MKWYFGTVGFLLGVIAAGIGIKPLVIPKKVVQAQYMKTDLVESVFRARMDTTPRLGQTYHEVQTSWCKGIDSVAHLHLAPDMPGYYCEPRNLVVIGGLVDGKAKVIGILRWTGPLPND